MILLTAVVAAFVVSVLSGGRPGRLANVRFQWAWLAPAAFALQAYIIYRPSPRAEGLLSAPVLVMMASYGLLVLLLWRNRQLFGVKLITVGLVMNLTVMIANGGYMPVTRQSLERAGHAHLALGSEPGARIRGTKDILLPSHAIKLWWLSDIFIIPPPAPITGIFSLGDVMIAVGAFWFLYKYMQEPSIRCQNHTLTEDKHDMGDFAVHCGNRAGGS